MSSSSITRSESSTAARNSEEISSSKEEVRGDLVGLAPRNVATLILQNFNPPELAICSLVSKVWKDLTANNDIWRIFIPENILQKIRPEHIAQKNEVPNYREFVIQHIISEGEIPCKMQNFINSLEQNETGRISFKFLDKTRKEFFFEIGNFIIEESFSLTTVRAFKRDIRENPLKKEIYFIKDSKPRQEQLEVYKKRQFESPKAVFVITEQDKVISYEFDTEELRLSDSEEKELETVLESKIRS